MTTRSNSVTYTPLPVVSKIKCYEHGTTNYKIVTNIGNNNNTKRKNNLPDDFGIRLALERSGDYISTQACIFYFHDPCESQTHMDSRMDWG